MEKTFAKLAAYMAKEKANEIVSGRKSKYCMPEGNHWGYHEGGYQRCVGMGGFRR
jgi:hypothetical protein